MTLNGALYTTRAWSFPSSLIKPYYAVESSLCEPEGDYRIMRKDICDIEDKLSREIGEPCCRRGHGFLYVRQRWLLILRGSS